MVNHNACPLCSSTELTLKFNARDHFISGEVFPVSECGYCGFVFTSSYPDENEMGRYYDSGSYISHSNTSEGLVSRLYKLIRSLMLRRKTRLVKEFTGKQTGQILDVGCGTGYFLNAMKNAGWNVRGIEVSQAAREFASSNFKLDVYQSLDNVPPGFKFDCITLWHVLEHFHYPFEYIAQIHNMLKPGGVLIIALPNSKSYDAEHYQESWAAYDVPRHLWHFNPGTFKKFAEMAGLKNVVLRYLPFDVFYISILSEKYLNSKLSFIRGIVKGAFFALLSVFKPGKTSSVFYILK